MRALVLVVFAFALAAAPAFGAQVTTLSDGRTMVVDAPPGELRGVALLIPGGSSQLQIGAGGSPMPSGNFVIRTRAMWGSAGFAIAYLNDPTDLREPIAKLRALGRPIVLVSTSRGTIVAGQNAAEARARRPGFDRLDFAGHARWPQPERRAAGNRSLARRRQPATGYGPGADRHQRRRPLPRLDARGCCGARAALYASCAGAARVELRDALRAVRCVLSSRISGDRKRRDSKDHCMDRHATQAHGATVAKRWRRHSERQ